MNWELLGKSGPLLFGNSKNLNFREFGKNLNSRNLKNLNFFGHILRLRGEGQVTVPVESSSGPITQIALQTYFVTCPCPHAVHLCAYAHNFVCLRPYPLFLPIHPSICFPRYQIKQTQQQRLVYSLHCFFILFNIHNVVKRGTKNGCKFGIYIIYDVICAMLMMVDDDVPASSYPPPYQSCAYSLALISPSPAYN